eukprot:gnl/MRDRNA2_/MRDRNA2_17704_c0_seq1.p1 gnl/MRDRNA2_/MRDRNA2_17704_c0~~gnl/MRDRNA2_/MRDRNA2_17704_c0_seq1.p1  ORF type:complete len:154 (+),score=16.83 gnl/MRDRNA2_/MRDRNA2_17704_c0_seq1:81-542(+)
MICAVSPSGEALMTVLKNAGSCPVELRQPHATLEHVIPPLVTLLRSSNDQVRTYAARVVGDITKDSAENQVKVAKAGAIPLLVALLSSSNRHDQTSAARALANIGNNTENQVYMAKAAVIQPLEALLNSSNIEAQTHAARVLENISVAPSTKS